MKKSLPICTRHCRQLVFLVALLTLFVCQSAPAYAREQSGSLQIECKVHHDNDTFFLAGDTYAVVQIATVSVGNAEGSPSFTYQICEAFKAFDCDWDNLTDEELRAKSKALQAYAEKMNLLSIKQTTDQHGQVVFNSLETGLYLVVRTSVSEKNESYQTDPFLVSIPVMIDDTLIYSVTATPKFEYHPVVEQPDTGDTNWLVEGIFWLTTGMSCLLVGLISFKKIG
ncbi:hypothetical protein H6A12_02740 [Phocea massiliensis]|uniref:Gram-positive pilin subunit D1 N-terminal domain-containing protein n=1 Tax=Merdimmobilis hominis TaxID=2897707 RepID=A0A938X512_9FIRM|nr:hypothetical protein [Merdimmobilis hominis]MBM6920078.1 hypothetical protein [Merdimmobilis hominis]